MYILGLAILKNLIQVCTIREQETNTITLQGNHSQSKYNNK